MTELLIWVIIWTIPASIISYELIKLSITTYLNHEKPTPINYVWRNIHRPHVDIDSTKVYYDAKTNWIRGKVVMQPDGLYRATMWNATEEDFIFQHEAVKWVEEYRPRVYK